jgi:hypothetical protein
MSHSQPLAERIADAPFDGRHGAQADVILRSKDSVLFYLHKSILSFVSPVFLDMFSLPQPPSGENDALLVIDVTEDSKTIDCLLHHFYPVPAPVINELRDIADVLEAARKYQIEHATRLVKLKLLDFINSKPLQTYAIACLFHLEEEAKAAAECWRKGCPKKYSRPYKQSPTFPGWDETTAARSYVQEMAEVSAGAYFRLLRFIRTGNAKNFTKPDSADTVKSPTKKTPLQDLCPPDLEDADIILQSSEGVNFRVHKWIVSMASSRLLSTESGLQDDLPVFKVFEDARTLGALLWLCYPFCDPETVDIDVAGAVLRAARKYRINKVILLMKKRYRKEVRVNPLRVYFAAVHCGWKDEAQEAASCAAVRPMEESYVPEMDRSPAVVYHFLLQYCHNYRSKLTHLMDKRIASSSELYSGSRFSDTHEYLHQDAPAWWYLYHENEGNVMPFIASPMALVKPYVEFYTNSGYNSRLSRESVAFATELKIALSEVCLDCRELFIRQFHKLSCRLSWTTKFLKWAAETPKDP